MKEVGGDDNIDAFRIGWNPKRRKKMGRKKKKLKPHDLTMTCTYLTFCFDDRGVKKKKPWNEKKTSTDIATTDIAPKYDFWRMIKNQNPKNSEKE